MKAVISSDLMAGGLGYIPANLTRDEWAKILAGIKAEFPNQIGLDLALNWSATAGDGFNEKSTRETWKSLKAAGAVSGATVLYEAKQRGFDLAAWHREHDTQTPEQTPEQKRADDARRIHERAANQAREQATQQAAHEHAAAEAALLWQQASDTGESPYLPRKGVQGYGVRFTRENWLLVPMHDTTGKLWNLQRIGPIKPASGTDKLFLKGGRKTGLFHWCGNPELEPVLLVCEGYATAASVHQATARPVAVAFDAGNLLTVCKALRTMYPDALIVVAGDDDHTTEARTGQNPGRIKATAAVGGLAVFPESLPEGGSDFNDMHQAAGLDAVRLLIDCN